ncbi:carbonic anhydrase [Caminibacter mediatlanticus TB-2]|uniref:Carbonic anhydrase n=1 Tax=Caminibacter mediatlanticus TB-2 TaxID=391592 RepID=A0AAI9AJ45_9BACT|nr:carbonic anhydrase [Caminibacter mediatlanticus]EDM24480.1 CARBONIC ANYHYDRASE [Caminibacter mediatlanticus TB-2]QCT95127.1 carbonic anhydrase [Caminibacter mediatlanticus TB-2]
MEKIFKGVIHFKQEDYESHKELFKELKKGQKPHTFFIGCSDSRVIPNLITKTLPGELFVVRNIANVIPPCNINDGTYKCTASAVEYAVKYLNVKNIVICGHSNCGGLKALFYSKEKLEKLPFVNRWLDIIRPLKEKVKDIKDEGLREWEIEQLNILAQIENLLTYDFVKDKFEKEELNIYGWYYIIETGEVYNYNFEKEEFELIG